MKKTGVWNCDVAGGGGGLPIPEGLTSAWEECARGREGETEGGKAGVEPVGGGPQGKA